MSETVRKINEFVVEKCEQHKKNPDFGYYDYWNDHIKRVVYHAVNLAHQYGADVEAVELAALLHDVSMPSEYGDRNEHNYYSAEMAEKLLTDLNYPKNKLELVKRCVLNHSGRNAHLRNTLEEICIADADALAHFDRIPSLFSLAYGVLGMKLEEGRDYVKRRLQGDYNDLSERTRQVYGSKLEAVMVSLFVD